MTDPATGQTIRVRIDNTVTTPAGVQLVDAKFSSVRNLANPNVDLSTTVTVNQEQVFEWISQGKQVTVVPQGPNAVQAGLTPGMPIQVNPNVQVHVNSPTGTVVRKY